MTREVHRSSLRQLICPAQDHFIFLSVDHIYDFCPLPDPDVSLSIFVCDVEHTSFHFDLCARKFVLCLFGQWPGLHRRTGQHPFGGADRVLPEWIQWGGGGSTRNFPGSIFSGGGGVVAEIFRDPYFVGWHNFFR